MRIAGSLHWLYSQEGEYIKTHESLEDLCRLAAPVSTTMCLERVYQMSIIVHEHTPRKCVSQNGEVAQVYNSTPEAGPLHAW